MKALINFFVTPVKIIKLILRYQYGYIVFALLNIVLDSVIPLLSVYAPKLIIEKMTDGSEREETVTVILFYISVLLILSVIKEVLAHKTQLSADRFVRELRLDIGKRMMILNVEDIEASSAKDIAYMAKNAENIVSSISLFKQMISNLITIVGLSVLIMNLDTIFFAMVGFVLAFKMVFTYIRFRHIKKVRVTDAGNNRALEYLQGLAYFEHGAEKEIRVNSLQDWFIEKTKKYRINMVKMQYKDFKFHSAFEIALSVIGAIQSFIVLFILVNRYLIGELTIADFSMYFSAIVSLTSTLSLLANQIGAYSNHTLDIRDYENLNNLEITEYKQNSDVRFLTENNDFYANVEIKFINVSFSYKGSDRRILQNINLKISNKEKFLIVGYNGSGKTTLIKLLCKFYRPTEGVITLNGVDIWDIPNELYYSVISAVFQDYSNFAFTIRDNVILGNMYDKDKINSIFENIGLNDKINSLPEGENTYISKIFSDKGVELSGGEGQKIAISRALYKESPIMILDEPTAALDVKTESKMYEDFLKIAKSKTAIFISHRLAISKLVDNIIVLDNGKVAEHGNHRELMRKNGIYRKMYELQSKPYTTDGEKKSYLSAID